MFPISLSRITATLVFLTVTIFSTNAMAQENLQKGGGWLGTFAKKSIDEDFSFWAETQARYDFEVGVGQILYRTGLLYNLRSQNSLGFLYGYIQGGNNKEHRWTLQHGEKYGSWGLVDFSHRVRLEGRSLEGGDDSAAWRFRYLLRAQTNHKSCYKYVAWNETFVNMTNDVWTGSTTWDRNRFFIGIRQKFYNSNFEFGYLNQWVWRNPRDTVEHLLVIYLFL